MRAIGRVGSKLLRYITERYVRKMRIFSSVISTHWHVENSVPVITHYIDDYGTDTYTAVVSGVYSLYGHKPQHRSNTRQDVVRRFSVDSAVTAYMLGMKVTTYTPQPTNTLEIARDEQISKTYVMKGK